MILSRLKDKGIPLPTFEAEDGLTAQYIMNKIRSFHHRPEKSHSEICGYVEGYFLELMVNYPKSMCNRQMTET